MQEYISVGGGDVTRAILVRDIESPEPRGLWGDYLDLTKGRSFGELLSTVHQATGSESWYINQMVNGLGSHGTEEVQSLIGRRGKTSPRTSKQPGFSGPGVCGVRVGWTFEHPMWY